MALEQLLFDTLHPLIDGPSIDGLDYVDADIALNASTKPLVNTDAVSNTAYAEDHFAETFEEMMEIKARFGLIAERAGSLRAELESIRGADGMPYGGRFSKEVLKELLARLKRIEDGTTVDYFLFSNAGKIIQESPDAATLGERLRVLSEKPSETDAAGRSILQMARDRVLEYERELEAIEKEIEVLKQREV